MPLPMIHQTIGLPVLLCSASVEVSLHLVAGGIELFQTKGFGGFLIFFIIRRCSRNPDLL